MVSHLGHFLVDARYWHGGQGHRGLGVATGILGGRGRGWDAATPPSSVIQVLGAPGGQPPVVPGTGHGGRVGPAQESLSSEFNLIIVTN